MDAQNDERLTQFLDFLQAALCRSCWTARHGRTDWYHHHGGLIYQMARCHLDAESFAWWVGDAEHGLVHGLCTAYHAFQTTPGLLAQVMTTGSPAAPERTTEPMAGRPMDAERLLLACLFHDVFKRQADHDSQLSELTGMFDPAVYRHANPLPSDEDHPLVGADRLELLRYADTSWVDRAVIARYDYGIGDFYTRVRPVIERVVLDLDSPWAAHIIENAWGGSGRHTKTYPERHWLPKDTEVPGPPNRTHYAISVGRLPVAGCHMHHQNYCRGNKLPLLTGLIPCRKLKITSAPDSTWGRDHPFARKPAPALSEWVFAYENPSDMNLLGPAAGIPLSSLNLLVESVRQLLALAESLMVNV